MNCKNCGASLVNGQIVCSNCDFVNEVDKSVNNTINSNYMINNDYNDNQIDSNINENSSYEKQDNNLPKKQHIIFKISSIISLIASIGLLFAQMGNVFVVMSLKGFDIKLVIGLVLALVMLFGAYFTSNYNISKSDFFDNKIVFIILLILTLIFGFFVKLYLLVFILNLLGFIITNRNKKNY